MERTRSIHPVWSNKFATLIYPFLYIFDHVILIKETKLGS